jgi:hypothetical protein
MIKINLSKAIDPLYVNEELTEFKFISIQKDGQSVELVVHIKENPIHLLPNVFNLAFGPLNADGQIDDTATLNHVDLNLVFSTIIFYTLAFLEGKSVVFVGIDGSDERRAYLYHRMFNSNYKYLSDIIVPIGVDWYVRLLRDNTIEMDNTGNPYFKPRPEPFDRKRKSTDLYRYYIISLKE